MSDNYINGSYARILMRPLLAGLADFHGNFLSCCGVCRDSEDESPYGQVCAFLDRMDFHELSDGDDIDTDELENESCNWMRDALEALLAEQREAQSCCGSETDVWPLTTAADTVIAEVAGKSFDRAAARRAEEQG